MIQEAIGKLIQYGIGAGLIGEEDRLYTQNRLLELFDLDEPGEMGAPADVRAEDLESILGEMLEYAHEKGILPQDDIVHRDLFDTRIMGLLTPPPSAVIRRFKELFADSPQKATEYYYQFSQDTDYIRRYRIQKDKKWTVDTEYGKLDITINLSKPEKDPRAIAAAKQAKQSGYPKCQLCVENVGYRGRTNHPARQNHRIIPVTLAGEDWYFQYSPYVYYNEHCIVLNSRHIPMKIERDTFCKLLDFEEQFPHYYLGSNADLPIVGGSILSHEHFQGGNYEFPMDRAPIERYFEVKGFEEVEAGIVKWPMSVIRLRSADREKLTDLSDLILKSWRGYTDETAFVYAQTDGEPHNTITPIAHCREGKFVMDLVLRNNITTPEHPLGVYHPHAKLHHIKKENIGLIEVMGLAILPSRLRSELELLQEAILQGRDIRGIEAIEKHADWIEEILPKYADINADNIEAILQKEVGLVFCEVLHDAGVFKRTREGAAAFDRFTESLSKASKA